MARRWEQAYDGEWFEIPHRTLQIRCCDCGKSHLVNFRLRRGRIQMRAWQDKRSTAANRRWRRHRGESVLTKER